MSDQKHTPGPWRMSEADEFGDYAIQPANKGLAIAAVCNGGMHELCGSTGEHEANARLIAAAPSLLDALVDMVNAAEHCGDGGAPVVVAARAAITLATGKAES